MELTSFNSTKLGYETLRACETRSQCVSLAPPRRPLKLSLLHSIVFHMLLNTFF